MTNNIFFCNVTMQTLIWLLFELVRHREAQWRSEMTGQTYVRSLLRPALNADLIVSIHRVIQKGSDFISIESTSDLTRAI